MSISLIKKHEKKIKFVIIGGLAAATNFIFLFLLYDILKISLNPAVSTAYLLSLLVHFTGNKFLVFQEKTTRTIKKQLVQYVLLVICYYLLNLLFVNILVMMKVNIYAAAALSIVILMVLSYLVMNKVIFIKEVAGHGK